MTPFDMRTAQPVQRCHNGTPRRLPCWCLPPVVISAAIAVVCVAVLLYDVRTVWAIEARCETIVRQNEQLTTENVKLRTALKDAIIELRRERGG